MTLASARKHLPEIMAALDKKMTDAIIQRLGDRKKGKTTYETGVDMAKAKVVSDMITNGELESFVEALTKSLKETGFGIQRGVGIGSFIHEMVDSKANSTASLFVLSSVNASVLLESGNVVEALAKIAQVSHEAKEVQIGTLLHYTLYYLLLEESR